MLFRSYSLELLFKLVESLKIGFILLGEVLHVEIGSIPDADCDPEEYQKHMDVEVAVGNYRTET